MSVSRRLLNLLTVWLPLLFMGWQLVLEFTVPENVLANLMSESGPHEFIQFLVITLAFLLAVWILLAERGRLGPWERTWIALAAICSLYVSCEEVSWGQHLLQWQTPEYWARINDQDETNLHNTSSWLDQKPRIALELGVFVGGVVIPLLRRFRPSALPARFASIYPPDSLFTVAVLATMVKIADFVAEETGLVLFERASEVIELYMFYFVMLYLMYFKIGVRGRDLSS